MMLWPQVERMRSLRVPKPCPCRSCCMFVLMKDTSQTITPTDVEPCDRGWFSDRLGQRMQRPGVRDPPVRSVGVVMALVLAEDVQQMVLVPDQRPVQQFITDTPRQANTRGRVSSVVRTRCPFIIGARKSRHEVPASCPSYSNAAASSTSMTSMATAATTWAAAAPAATPRVATAAFSSASGLRPPAAAKTGPN
jgi:hypothetical protein